MDNNFLFKIIHQNKCFLSFITGILALIQIKAVWGAPVGIVGGKNLAGTQPSYAALIESDGTLLQITGIGFPQIIGSIQTVAMNRFGIGLIGGENATATLPAFAALIAPDGTITQLTGAGFPSTTGVIYGVAINDAGNGLIGGFDLSGSGFGYAALVAPSGALTQLSGAGFPSTEGTIHSVAINNSGYGLIGGIDLSGGFKAFAAFVAPSGALTQLTGSNFPSISGNIANVAINDSGFGLIGGRNLAGAQPAYAALVAPNGTLTQLLDSGFPSTTGSILSVAINSSKAGLIGGQNLTGGQPAYAALVAPNGDLTQLAGPGFPTTSGYISSVAINDAGIGLIGGVDLSGGQPAYLALVAPNGTLTQLTGTGFPSITGTMNAVALAPITPEFIGLYMGAINTQLAASYALDSHFIETRRLKTSSKENQKLSFLASSKDSILEKGSAFLNEPADHSIWIAPFGNYINQAAQGKNPSCTNELAGIFLGYDHFLSDLLFGGGAGYAFNYISYGSGLGHGKIQEEMVCFYGSYKQPYLFVDFALWAGLYQFDNTRHTFSFITSTSNSHGWIFSPHAELTVPFQIQDKSPYFIEPLIMLDWVNSWQGNFTEKGASGLNLVMDDHYSSLLRSEVGVRFIEEWNFSSGKLLFEQKASYVNQAPFHFGSVNTFFVASASTFPIAIGSSNVQNLGSVETHMSFLPCNRKYPSFVFDFQGEFGSSYQSYFLNLEIGKSF